MKNFTDKIKNLLKKTPKKATSNPILNPHKHWKLLLYIFFVVVIMLIIFSLDLLYEIKNDQVFKVGTLPQNSTNLLKENLLKSINDSFDQKAEKEKIIKSNPPTYKDPSL